MDGEAPRLHRKALIEFILFAAALGSMFAVTGCGYSFQGTDNPLLSKYGVRRVYVAPLSNDSYKPGVQNVVYNQLLKVIAANKRVKIVNRPEDSDAVLTGTVTDAAYSPTAVTGADQLYPPASITSSLIRPSGNIAIATQYNATLSCSFSLTQFDPGGAGGKRLWSGGFSRSQTFPGNNQLGNFGTTSALINESEFDRALAQIAEGLMYSVHESMLAMF